MPLKNCLRLQMGRYFESMGLLCYERLTTMCYLCRCIGHVYALCYFPQKFDEGLDLPYDECLNATTEASRLIWTNESSTAIVHRLATVSNSIGNHTPADASSNLSLALPAAVSAECMAMRDEDDMEHEMVHEHEAQYVATGGLVQSMV